MQLERDRRRDPLHGLRRVGDDDEALGGGGDDLLARVGAAAALDQPAVGRDLVGAVDREVEAVERRRSPRPGCPSSLACSSVATEVATQRISFSPRSAIAGSRKATVEPVPSPTVIPSSTSSAAASAASFFSDRSGSAHVAAI